MVEQFEDPDAHKEAILAKAGFSRPAAWTMSVVKDVAMGALKGAVILGLIAATITILPAGIAGIAGTALNWASFGAITSTTGTGMMTYMATQGAALGAMAGGAIGLITGFSNADDAVEDKEQMILSKYHRAQQFVNNEKMMKMAMSNRMQPGGQQVAAGGMGYDVRPQHHLPQGIGPERTV